MRSDVIEKAARRLVDVRRGEASPFHPVEAEGPGDLVEAYAVQTRVQEIVGANTGAWKVGGPLSGQPMMAPIFVQDVMTTPVSLDSWQPVGIECEIAFVLATDLPSRAKSYSSTEVEAAIEAVLPVVETVTARLNGFMNAPVYWKLADNQVNGGLVLGPKHKNFTAAMWQQASVRLLANGREIKRGVGANPGGDSLGLLTWLANHIGDHAGGLKAGQVVTTGSYTGLDMFEPGTAIEADFGQLGRIEITI